MNENYFLNILEDLQNVEEELTDKELYKKIVDCLNTNKTIDLDLLSKFMYKKIKYIYNSNYEGNDSSHLLLYIKNQLQNVQQSNIQDKKLLLS